MCPKRPPFSFSNCLTFSVIAFALATGFTALTQAGAAYKPKDASEVLERVALKPLDHQARELREQRAELQSHPENLTLALNLARRYLDKSRTEVDPRYLGYAQACLAPWWKLAEPPVDVLVLRATVHQSNHDFPAALTDLDQAVRRDPKNLQAWLVRATVLQVTGQLDAAKRACLPLLQIAPELVSGTVLSQIASLTGSAASGRAALAKITERNPGAPVNERLWSLTALAEITSRSGDAAGAEKYFRQALALRERDPYLQAAYADFLLDEGRPAEVELLLEDETRADALLLRLALAKQMSNKHSLPVTRELARLEGMLSDRFAAAHLRGDSVHRREEAIFQLKLRHQALKALELAEKNWEVQREPADARIFLEAALASSQPERARPVLVWLAKYGLEDKRLRTLAETCEHRPIASVP